MCVCSFGCDSVVWSGDSGRIVWSGDSGSGVWSADSSSVAWSGGGRSIVWSGDSGSLKWFGDRGSVDCARHQGTRCWFRDSSSFTGLQRGGVRDGPTLPEALAPLRRALDPLTQVSKFTPQSFNVRAMRERERGGRDGGRVGYYRLCENAYAEMPQGGACVSLSPWLLLL